MSDDGGRTPRGVSSDPQFLLLDAARPAPVPGRSKLEQEPVSPDSAAAFKITVESMRRKTTVLDRAIGELDFLAAWYAANDLRKTIVYAEGLEASLASPEVTRLLHDARAAAEPLLAIAPSPSQAAIEEATSRARPAPHGRWNAEERRWLADRGQGAGRQPGAFPRDVLGNYDSAVGKHVLVLRTWDSPTIAARRVELQGRLSRTTDAKARDELLREYEAIEWVARERNLALPKDPGEEAAPQAFVGGKPTKFWVPDNAQGMRAMLEREMAAGGGYHAAREHAQARIGYATMSRSPTANDKQVIGDQQTALMDHDVAAFCASFQTEAKQTALAMLDASTVAIDVALRSYGIAGGAFRLTDAAHKIAKDPSSLDVEVEKWVALSSHADGNHAAFAVGHGHRDDLAHKAQELRALQENIAALASEQLRLLQLAQSRHPEHPGMARPAKPFDASTLDARSRRPHPLQGSTQNPFDQLPKPSLGAPEEQLAFVRGALQARQAQFKIAWTQAERAHPVLAAFRARKDPDASTLAGIGSDDATTRTVLRQILPKLGNIYRTKAALQGTWSTLDPMQLGPVVELTKQRMFVAQGSYRDRAVHDMIEQAQEKHGGLVPWALEAVMIGLTLVTLVPTAGASAAVGLALTGLAYDIYAGLDESEDLKLMSSAGDTDLDKIRALSDTEPSLTPLLTRMLSAGLNLTVAAGLLRRAAALRRIASTGSIDPEALAALNKAGDVLGVEGVGNEAIGAGTSDSAKGASSRASSAAGARSRPDPHETVTIQGLAQTPKYAWTKNAAGHVRSVAEARALAINHGILIPEDIKFVAVDGTSLPKDTFAQYLYLGASSIDEMISWEQFYNRFEQIPVKLSKDILNSDEAIVAVIGHEMHELNELRAMFEARGGSIPARELRNLIVPGRPGNLHDHAWDTADQLVKQMRGQAGHDK